MNVLKSFFIALTILMGSFGRLSATTINPFPNLGEMAKFSEAVVVVKVDRNYTQMFGEIEKFRTSVTIIDQVVGPFQIGEQIVLQNFRQKIGEMERMIFGDLELEEGEKYFLFLARPVDDYWQPKMLSYGALKHEERNGEQLFVPVDMGREVHFYKGAGAVTPETLGVFKVKPLITHIKSVVHGNNIWDASKVLSTFKVEAFDNSRMLPSHCTTVISNVPITRWSDMSTTALPVHYGVAGDAGCSTVNTKIQTSIGILNANYTGIQLIDGGTHSFIPTCSGQGATGPEFTTWVSNNLGGNRHVVIQHNDPCDEIQDLNGCSGTLAMGGLYSSSATHTGDGMTWRNALFGFVYVNNGTGACQCAGTGYNRMIEHEVSHSLNIGHIAPGNGQANMNPSCCIAIQALDTECLNFLYPPASLPVELTDFFGAQNKEEITLNWVTASERDNAFYLVEKLNLSSNEFEKLARVEGEGHSDVSLEYQIADKNPTAGKNYYRLSQTDFSGEVTSFNTIEIDFKSNEVKLLISPNPIENESFWMEGTLGNKDQNCLLQILNLQGVVEIEMNLALESGTLKKEINVEKLGKGIHYVRLIASDGTFHIKKFVKIR